MVVLDDLRTVLIIHYPPIGPGENVTFKLKKRRKFENTIYNAESFVEEEDFIRIQKIYYDEIKELKEGEKKLIYDYIRELNSEGDQEMRPFAEKVNIKILSLEFLVLITHSRRN